MTMPISMRWPTAGLALLLQFSCAAPLPAPVDSLISGLPVSPLELLGTPEEFSALRKSRASGAASDGAGLCETLTTHTRALPITAVEKPPYRQYYRDPAFGTRIIRISDSRTGEVYKPAYSTVQAWNADESRLLLYHSDRRSGPVLLDGHSYKLIRQLPVMPADIEEIFWSHTDPDTLFFVSSRSRDYGHFNRYSVKNNKVRKITDFARQCGTSSLPVGGGDVHMQSYDDDLFGFRCKTPDRQWRMFTYRISTDTVTEAATGENTPWEPWTAPMPTPSGQRLWLQGAALSTDLATVTRRMDMYKTNEHSSLGRTHNGQDALFQTVFDPSPNGCDGDTSGQGVGHLVVHNLEDGSCRPVINEARGYPYTTSGTHVSAIASKQPGWVAMSSIGYDQFQYLVNAEAAPALMSEIYLANTDPDNEVICRLAQHRSTGKSARNAQYQPYLGEPHVTISPSGTRLLFASDWYDSGAVDSYVIELPSYRQP